MAPQQIQWGTSTLHLDNETFRKAFSSGRSRYFDDCAYDFPQIAHRMHTLDAAGSVLDEDGKGGYRFDRMTFKDPFDMLGFAPSLHERPDYRRKPTGARRTHETRCGITGRSKPDRNSFVGV